MAEKNRYISILATVSPRQRLLPRPKESTLGCGVKARPSAERCLSKKNKNRLCSMTYGTDKICKIESRKPVK